MNKYIIIILAFFLIGAESFPVNEQVELPDVDEAGELIALWHMNDDVDPIIDSSPNSHTGTASGAPVNTAGYFDNCEEVDGVTSSSYFTIADAADLDFISTSNFTIVLWYYLDDFANDVRPIMAKRGATVGNTTFQYYINQTTGKYRFFDGVAEREWNEVANLNTWTFLAIVHEAGVGQRLYENGVLEATIPNLIGKPANNDAIIIFRDGSTGANYFDGRMDDISIYGRAMAVEEIIGKYNQQVGVH